MRKYGPLFLTLNLGFTAIYATWAHIFRLLLFNSPTKNNLRCDTFRSFTENF